MRFAHNNCFLSSTQNINWFLVYRFVCFIGKLIVKDNFPHFTVSGCIKKIGQQKTIFSQWKTLIKIRFIFYRFFFLENNLFHVAHNYSYKYYLFLAWETIFSFVPLVFPMVNSLVSSFTFVFFFFLNLFLHPHWHPFWALLIS